MTPFPTSDQSKSPPAITDSRNRKNATLVLGTPVEQDARQRMERAIALAKRYPDNIIVALGTHVETAYMKSAALENRFPPSRLVVDENSKTTVDNAYYAKQICQLLDLRPEFLVTSQYQLSRASSTFKRVFGPNYSLKLCPSPSITTTSRRVRETILRILTPVSLQVFRRGDDEALKRASDKVWKLLFH
ncbi:hypothetical protein AUG19_04930 [archaeon 13_1_20CM_2_54_9]|nr:MAG: hypothetical protein AUG19_04930 [archaeon 13_1_20CM_2_54_9]